jgi:serine protease
MGFRRLLVLAAAGALLAAPAASAGERQQLSLEGLGSLWSAGSPVPEWQWTATRADLVPAWVRRRAASVTIAVVDTGADLTVPTLAGKSAGTWDVTDDTASVVDVVGHGTFVAALAAGGVDTTVGMSGFGGDARLLIVQANRGGPDFSDADEAAGIVWAVDHGANIVNLSMGGRETSQVERAAIRYAVARGVLLVAAAGNGGDAGNPVVYPAALVGRAGLVVGASTPAGDRAPFSTSGRDVDVLAPGVDVVSAVSAAAKPGLYTLVPTPGSDGAYGLGTGTSSAAPEAAGAAALVWAANPTLTAREVADVIDASASGHGRWTRALAFGTLDVAAAVERALSLSPLRRA